MLMQLLPGQIDSLRSRQAIERVRFDRMTYALRFACRGDKVEPASRCESRGIEFQNVFRYGIAATKTVKQPAIEFLLSQRGLNRLNQGFIHFSSFLVPIIAA